LKVIQHATPLADWVVVLPVVLCLLGAALLLMLRTVLRIQSIVCAGVVLLVLVCDGVLFERVMSYGPLSMTIGGWLPPFGISFTADVMGAGFALLAAFVTIVVVLYLEVDTPESARRDGLYPLVLLLLAGVSGAFLTGDMFNLYDWFEVMLIASFGLIVLAGHPLQLDGAVKYGILNFLATTLFLAALGLLYGLLGTLNMADIIGAAKRADSPALAAVAALFALAFGMKAAVFPVNAWLPASYHTPPPAISALMGALLTKVGAYAFIRTLVMLLPAAGDSLASAITVVGIATMLLGPLGAIAETNLRRAIGFMLIGGIGIITICVPQGHIFALSGGILYIAHAMLTLAALYLVAGMIERVTGQFDTRNMGGLYTSNAVLSWLFLVLILAISGVPPFLGFWPKLLMLQGFVADRDWFVVAALLLNALLTLIAGTRLWSHIFWRPGPLPAASSAAPATGAAALLTGTVVLLGLWPSLVLNAANAAAAGLLDPSRYIAAVGLSP
jgi:multicomponent Na+:H+ antiporter subunit D